MAAGMRFDEILSVSPLVGKAGRQQAGFVCKKYSV